MNLSKIIKDSCKQLNVSLAELSRRVGQSPQNLGKKLNNETLSMHEFLEMLNALGVKFEYKITLPNEKDDFNTGNMLNDRYRERIAILVSEIELQKRNIEYLSRTNRDVRTNLNVISCSAEIASKNINDKEKVLANLEMIKNLDAQVCDLLNATVGIKGTSLVTEEDIKEQTKDITLKGKSALVVEDDALNREIISDLLLDRGINVDTAENGEEAINKIKIKTKGYYNFIIMDALMPVMDGYAASKAIREMDETAPIIGLSSNANEEDIHKALESGMTDYIVKPTSADKLFFTIMKNLITK